MTVDRVQILESGSVRYWYGDDGDKLDIDEVIVSPQAHEVADQAGNLNEGDESDSFLRLKVICPWQNPNQLFDSNFDGSSTPIDALVIINELNAPKVRGDQGKLPTPAVGAIIPTIFYDVNCDTFASPLTAPISDYLCKAGRRSAASPRRTAHGLFC